MHKPNIVQTALQAELYNPTMKGALHEKNQKIISRDQQTPLQLYCSFVIARLTWGNFYSPVGETDGTQVETYSLAEEPNPYEDDLGLD